ncbi:MAG TPA: glycosyltransferase family 2 protein [Xanthobacteraceae bacterium]
MRAETIDLIRDQSARAQVEPAGNDAEAGTVCCRIDLDVRAAGVRGWQRLKLIWPGATIRRATIQATDGGAVLPTYDTLVRQPRLACYAFVGPAVTSISLRVYAETGDQDGLQATLRRIHPVEFVWRSSWRGLSARPLAYARYFRDPIDQFVVAESFPAPALDESDSGRYRKWMRQVEEPFERELLATFSAAATSEPPRVAVLMPVCDPEPTYLLKAIESVKAQTTPHWQLCIADDASTRSEIRDILHAAARDDPRIQLVLREQRGNISAATNDAFELVDAPLITCLDHDDLLSRRAVEIASACFNAEPGTELAYSDEDKIDQHDHRFLPYFKPDFSPELLYSYNYINHLTIHRAEHVRKAGMWRSGFDGAQDYDLALRVLEFADWRKVRHLPVVLYHWRAIAGSAALSLSYKLYAIEAGRAALAEHLARRGIAAEVGVASDTMFRIRYALPAARPRVAIIIPTRDKADLLRRCLWSIEMKTKYDNYEIIIVDNGSSEPDALALLHQCRSSPRTTVLSYPAPFNYAAINNYAVESTGAEFVCLLNNDTEVITPDWLSDMVGYALQPGVGCVGAKLLYENDSVQHAGVVVGLGGVAGHAFLRQPALDPGYFGRALVASNWSALTGACLLVRRAIYREVGGLDAETLQIAFNDIDFCIKVRDAGYRNVLTPHALLYHHESLSRGPEDTLQKMERFQREALQMQSRYGESLLNDPCYSPHLDRFNDFVIRAEPRP